MHNPFSESSYPEQSRTGLQSHMPRGPWGMVWKVKELGKEHCHCLQIKPIGRVYTSGGGGQSHSHFTWHTNQFLHLFSKFGRETIYWKHHFHHNFTNNGMINHNPFASQPQSSGEVGLGVSTVLLVVKKKPNCQCRGCKRRGFDLWVGNIPWSRAWLCTPIFLPGESHRQRSLAGYSP